MSIRTVVSARDATQRNSPTTGSVEDESTVLIATASRVCYWNGKRFEDGSEIEVHDSGDIYVCSLGHWVNRDGN